MAKSVGAIHESPVSSVLNRSFRREVCTDFASATPPLQPLNPKKPYGITVFNGFRRRGGVSPPALHYFKIVLHGGRFVNRPYENVYL